MSIDSVELGPEWCKGMNQGQKKEYFTKIGLNCGCQYIQGIICAFRARPGSVGKVCERRITDCPDEALIMLYCASHL